jgi:putative hydrolase of the HAD superfamily
MRGAPTAILLDCLGTLVALEPPAPRLAAALRVPLGDAERAMRTEIAYYRSHMHTAELGELRARCAAVVADELGVPVSVEALLAAITFTPFPDVVGALQRWRARGIRLVVCSNWDASLPEVLARTGLAPLLDGVVTSASVRVAKPDPRPVLEALRVAGARAGDALLIGDSPEDAAAGSAAGVRCVLVDRPRRTLADVDPSTV